MECHFCHYFLINLYFLYTFVVNIFTVVVYVIGKNSVSKSCAKVYPYNRRSVLLRKTTDQIGCQHVHPCIDLFALVVRRTLNTSVEDMQE